jgi:hypothetical protein
MMVKFTTRGVVVGIKVLCNDKKLTFIALWQSRSALGQHIVDEVSVSIFEVESCGLLSAEDGGNRGSRSCSMTL